MWKGWGFDPFGFSRRVYSHTVVVYGFGRRGVRDHAWIRREHVTDDVAIDRLSRRFASAQPRSPWRSSERIEGSVRHQLIAQSAGNTKEDLERNS